MTPDERAMLDQDARVSVQAVAQSNPTAEDTDVVRAFLRAMQALLSGELEP